MGRILLLCPEPLGHNQPAGVGIRFLEFARALLAEGHQVIVLSPDGGKVPGCETAPTTPSRIRDASAASEVAVLQGHVANEFFAHAARIPTVVDLYDPYIVENLHYYRERGDQVFRHDHATLTRSLLGGDFFLCASTSQRMFYLGALIAAGRFHPRDFERDPTLGRLIAITPFGVSRPRVSAPRQQPSTEILFGGIYDWYDPILAIESVKSTRQRGLNVNITFNRHPNPSLTPQSTAARAVAYVKDHRYDEFVKFAPWVEYESREVFYDRFVMSLLTFPGSLETDLAMRTRMFDYFWGGLPVISSSAPGTDEIIERYNCGRVVFSRNPEDYAAAIIETLSNSSSLGRMLDGTRAFVEEHQWDKVLRPLLDFCRDPQLTATRRDPHAEENMGSPWVARLKRKLTGIF